MVDERQKVGLHEVVMALEWQQQANVRKGTREYEAHATGAKKGQLNSWLQRLVSEWMLSALMWIANVDSLIFWLIGSNFSRELSLT